MFYLTGISLSFFLTLLLIGKQQKTKADKILAVWLFLLCLHLFLYYVSFSAPGENFRFLFGLHFPMPLLYGPFLYWYAGSLTSVTTFNKKWILLHFLPALACYLAFIPFYLMPFQQKMSIVQNGGGGYQPIFSISVIAIIISGIVYVVLTSILLYRHRHRILDEFSYTEKITLRWLQYLTYGIGLIWVFIIFSNDELIYAVAVLFILFVGYFGIRQVGIFTHHNAAMPAMAPANENKIMEVMPANEEWDGEKKYSKSGLTGDAANRLHQELTALMQTEKLFREGDLTLVQLAARLHAHPNHLSQVINEKEQKNFFDYINTLRTREFIAMLSHAATQKYTLLGLAYECGFNSKSSFNKYFKKITGRSPSEYQRDLQALDTNPADN